MTRDEVNDALWYWEMRAKTDPTRRGGRLAARKILVCKRLLRMKARHGEGQLLRYRWDELPMPPKGKTA